MNRFFVILFSIFFYFSFAQNESDLFMEKLNIKKEYDPNIKKSIKKHNQPIYIDSVKVEKKQVQYINQEISDYSFFEKIDVKKSPKMSRLYQVMPNNKILFGAGNQYFFEMDLMFNELSEFQQDWGISFDSFNKNFFVLNNLVKNQDSSNSHKYMSLDGFSKSNLSFYWRKDMSNFQINSGLDFLAQNGLYYGGAENHQLDSVMSYNNLGLDLFFTLLKIDKKRGGMNSLDFNYSFFNKRHNRRQGIFDFRSNFSYSILSSDLNLDLKFQINNNKLLNPDFSNHPQSELQNISNYFEYFNYQTSYFYSIKPYINIWGQNLGFSYNWNSAKDLDQPHFFPYIHLVNKKYNLTFKYQGYLKSYFFSDLIINIPYLTPLFKDHFSQKNFYIISFNKMIDHKFSSKISTSYLYEKDYLVPFLLPQDYIIGSPMGMYFDNLRKINLNLNLSYKYADIETFLNINVNSMKSDYYDIKYLPRFSFEFFFQIKPVEKLLLSFDINYLGKREALRFNDFHQPMDLVPISIRELSNVFILNFDIKYRLSNHFKFNVGVRNLMDFQHELFDGYYLERNRRFFMNLTYSF